MAELALPQPAEEQALPAPVTRLELAEGERKTEIADPIADLKNAKKRSTAVEIMKALVADKILRTNERGEYLPVDPKNTVATNAVRIFNVLKYRLKEERAESPLILDAAKSRDAVRHIVKPANPQIQKGQTPKPASENPSKLEPKPSHFSPLHITLSNDKTYDTPAEFERFYQALEKRDPKKATELRAEYKAQLKDRVTMIREESEKEAKHVITAEKIKRQSENERPGVRDIVKIYEGVWITQNPQGHYDPLTPAAQPLADAANKRIRELALAQTKAKPTMVAKAPTPAAKNENVPMNAETKKSRLETEKLSMAIKDNPALKIITRALYAFADNKPEKIAPGMTLSQLETIIRKSVDLIDSDGNDDVGKKTPKGIRGLEALDVTPASLENIARDLNTLIAASQTRQQKAA